MDLHQNGSLTLTVQYFKRFNGFQLDFFSRIFFLVLLKVFFSFEKHVRVGSVECQTEVAKTKRFVPLCIHCPLYRL